MVYRDGKQSLKLPSWQEATQEMFFKNYVAVLMGILSLVVVSDAYGGDKQQTGFLDKVYTAPDGYEAKYVDVGASASRLMIPAPLSEEESSRVRELAVRAYLAIDCAGMARADFLLSGESGDLYVNELNTIPGFTAVSMYPKLWEASGLPYSEIIDRLIELAFERHRDRTRSETSLGLAG